MACSQFLAMRKILTARPFSFVSLCVGAVGFLAVAYIGLIAVVMSYAAMTVEFSQSVRNDEATLATLESNYLDGVTHITNIDVAAAGYEKPTAKVFVKAQSATTLR
jgi:acyl-coenzyme A synthetase/AMP-(fatty) acid ligase